MFKLKYFWKWPLNKLGQVTWQGQELLCYQEYSIFTFLKYLIINKLIGQ